MNGILNVLKPPGMTSHDVVSYLRRMLKVRKIGHTGTLDPEAGGVLPICLGRATKAVQYLTDKNKRYRANIKFGLVTDTQDKYGSIISSCEYCNINYTMLKSVTEKFIGEIEQFPPMFSAIKYNGKKLYQYAMEGEKVELKPRKVTIYSIDIKDMLSSDEAVIDVYCSKGTYIRSLCHDIGQVLGCGAYMAQLIRTEVAPFSINDSYTLEEVEKAFRENRFNNLIKSVDILFSEYGIINIKDTARNALLNGSPLYQPGILENIADFEVGSMLRIYNNNEFIALGKVSISRDEGKKFILINNFFV